MNTENYTKIIMEKEYIMLYDNRIAISWLDNFDDSIVDFNTAYRSYKIGAIVMFASVIQRDKIKKIYVNQIRMSIIFKGKIMQKKRELILPYNPHERETALQLLKETKLID